jgi:hypothetical protein|tara:strand:+ start:5995 stop:6330 length:336 start_codon:yes stop_codon:yes gene_type:complete
MNTKISYMYRDASNYKAYESEVIKGVIKESGLKDECFDEFIPNECGLPSLQGQLTAYNGGTWTEDDHVYHSDLQLEPTEKEPTVEITAEDFIKKFNNMPNDVMAEMERLGM